MEKKTVGEKYTVVVMLEQERRANAPEHQGRNGHKAVVGTSPGDTKQFASGWG